MGFDTYAVNTSPKAEKKSDVNWEDMNKYVVDTCQLEERETLVGYVSAIVDLGTQKLEDAEYVFEGSEEDEQKEIEKDSRVYFKDGLNPETKQPCRLKCVPQKDQQCVVMAVDFPDIILDKGQFFGESNPKPLRLWMGNQFYLPNHGMVVGRPTPLKVTNLDKTRKTKKWSFAQNSIFYKMAVAAKLIKNGECFLPNDIDKILGEAFQFSVQVYFRKGNDGKSYFTEYINFVGALGRGQAKPELVTSPFLVQFNKPNSPEALKELRSHVINTMKMSTNWEGSLIQKQLEEIRGNSESDTPAQESTSSKPEQKKVAKVNTEVSVEDDILKEDLPF